MDCGEKSGKGPKGLQRSPRSRGIMDRRLRFGGVLGGPWRALSGLQGTFSALQVLYSAARASVGMASAWPLPNLPLRLRLFLKDALFDFEPSGDLQRGSCCVEPRGPSRLPGDRPRTGWTGTPRHTFDNPSTLWHPLAPSSPCVRFVGVELCVGFARHVGWMPRFSSNRRNVCTVVYVVSFPPYQTRAA